MPSFAATLENGAAVDYVSEAVMTNESAADDAFDTFLAENTDVSGTDKENISEISEIEVTTLNAEEETIPVCW